ncbi:MAG: hypothetical protein RLZZ292_1266 [Bacteroidota bacterium]
MLVQLNYYTRDSIVKKKTLFYNDKRLLVEIKTFEVGVKEIYQSSKTFLYNARKEPVSQVENYYYTAFPFNTTYQYEWKNGNVINEKYSTNNVLHFEVNREYDDKHNFRPIDYDGTRLVHSRNNILKATYKNHSGVYELWTNPGIDSYQYNKDGLPTIQKKKGGSIETFEYECF